MSQLIHTEFNGDLQLRSVELLKGALTLPPLPNQPLAEFNFNVSLENQADPPNKLLFVIVAIEIRSKDLLHKFGELTASCIYHFSGFDECIKIEEGGKLTMPDALREILNSISISTARGIMFSTFKGTFLHNAILPIIDPKSFKPTTERQRLF